VERIGPAIVLVSLRQAEWSDALVEEWVTAQERLADDAEARVIVVTGRTNAFCRSSASSARHLWRGLLDCPVPVLAAVQGDAMGEGLMFGLAADVPILSDTGRYGVKLGDGSMDDADDSAALLTERLGTALCNEMVLGGRTFSGEQLCGRCVNVLVRPQSLVLPETLALASEVARSPRGSLVHWKRRTAGRHRPHRVALGSETEPGAASRDDGEGQPHAGIAALETEIAALLGATLHRAPSSIASDVPFSSLGLDSVAAVEVARDLSRRTGVSLDVTDLYTYASVDALARYIHEAKGSAPSPSSEASAAPAQPAVSAAELRDASRSACSLDAIRDAVASVFGVPIATLSETSDLRDLGLDAVSAAELVQALSARSGAEIDPLCLFDWPVLGTLAARVETARS
jgi:enoyl-CoA hydratase/carnithine racemase/acyl carrier protein